MSNDEGKIRDEELVCWVSMGASDVIDKEGAVSTGVKLCRPDCRAYRTWRDKNNGDLHTSCVFVSSINQISMVLNSKKGKPGG